MSRYRPSYDDFARCLDRAPSCIPVYRQLTGDALTPVSAFRRLERAAPSFLFESVIGGEKVGRFSFLGTEPFLTFEARGALVKIADAQDGTSPRRFTSSDPFRDLETLVDRHRAVAVPGLPRFAGGAVGYASYDAVRYTEHLPNIPPDDRGLPDLSFALYDRMVLFDHIRKTILVVAHAHLATATDPRSAYQLACHRADELVGRLAATGNELGVHDIATDGPVSLDVTSNFTRTEYEAVVRRCQEYIKAGDVFQVVPSQRFQRTTSARPFDIYRALRVVNPSPFLFLLNFGDFALIGSSPEILVRVEEGLVTIRPLAGTRRRGRNEDEDRSLAAELLADPKERAEHIMLVDLGRNDVGRVADYGTVLLSDVMKVERYSHVMHITSNVTGRLRNGQTAFDALRAGLPAGTVSGAPKVRAMEIIDEVERQKRGPYAGAVGYIDFTGNMDTCIALRTLVIQSQTAYIQAGGGIVYDSVPGDEYEETVNKARGLLKAIEIAETQLGPSPG
jgi:anthranilate synthase component 1